MLNQSIVGSNLNLAQPSGRKSTSEYDSTVRKQVSDDFISTETSQRLKSIPSFANSQEEKRAPMRGSPIKQFYTGDLERPNNSPLREGFISGPVRLSRMSKSNLERREDHLTLDMETENNLGLFEIPEPENPISRENYLNIRIQPYQSSKMGENEPSVIPSGMITPSVIKREDSEVASPDQLPGKSHMRIRRWTKDIGNLEALNKNQLELMQNDMMNFEAMNNEEVKFNGDDSHIIMFNKEEGQNPLQPTIKSMNWSRLEPQLHFFSNYNNYVIKRSPLSDENFEVYATRMDKTLQYSQVLTIKRKGKNQTKLSLITIMFYNYLMAILRFLCLLGCWNCFGNTIRSWIMNLKKYTNNDLYEVFYNNLCHEGFQNHIKKPDEQTNLSKTSKMPLKYIKLIEFQDQLPDDDISFSSLSDRFRDINRNSVLEIERKTCCNFLTNMSWKKDGEKLFNLDTKLTSECLSCRCGSCCSCETNPHIVPENVKPSWLKFVLSCSFFSKLLNMIFLPFSLVSCCVSSNYTIREEESPIGRIETVNKSIGEYHRVFFNEKVTIENKILFLSSIVLGRKEHQFLNLALLVLSMIIVVICLVATLEGGSTIAQAWESLTSF